MFILPSIFEIMFILIFLMVVVGFMVTIIKGVGQWNKNNQSPQLTVDATVITKRINVTHSEHGNRRDTTGVYGSYTATCTSYYVTFQVESGDRLEFCIHGREYGMLREGDYGKLMFQGSRYLGFQRQ